LGTMIDCGGMASTARSNTWLPATNAATCSQARVAAPGAGGFACGFKQWAEQRVAGCFSHARKRRLLRDHDRGCSTSPAGTGRAC
jgi:hypothetical protein